MSEASARPVVTVIMTVLDGERTLRGSVESILSQTFPDFELIVVDDGSTDATPAVLAEFAKDERVKIIRRGRLGRQSALNVAWREGKGEFVANLDADDLALPDRLEAQTRFIREHPDVALLGTGHFVLEEGTGTRREIPGVGGEAELRRRLLRAPPFVHSSVMMRRAVLERVGGYDERLTSTEDHDLWVRIAASHRISTLPEALVVKRIAPTAFFRHHAPKPAKARTRARVRFRAWRLLSRRVRDLPLLLASSWEAIRESLVPQSRHAGAPGCSAGDGSDRHA